MAAMDEGKKAVEVTEEATLEEAEVLQEIAVAEETEKLQETEEPHEITAAENETE